MDCEGEHVWIWCEDTSRAAAREMDGDIFCMYELEKGLDRFIVIVTRVMSSVKCAYESCVLSDDINSLGQLE